LPERPGEHDLPVDLGRPLRGEKKHYDGSPLELRDVRPSNEEILASEEA
jgi:hypothetical protein